LTEAIKNIPDGEISTVSGRIQIDPHCPQGFCLCLSVFNNGTGLLSHDTFSSGGLIEQEFLFQSVVRVKAKG
jgi:hypothetical protein